MLRMIQERRVGGRDSVETWYDAGEPDCRMLLEGRDKEIL